MPSEKILEQKKQTVAELTAKLKNAAAGVVVDYKGINVADDTKLRKELREAGVEYAVVKNSMLRFAAKEVEMCIRDRAFPRAPARFPQNAHSPPV